IPDLRKLKEEPARDDLPALLRKAGAKTVDFGREVPELISHEAVLRYEKNRNPQRDDFSYLILARPSDGDLTMIDEFRLDLRTGANLQNTDFANAEKLREALRLPAEARQLVSLTSANNLLSRGFVNMWVYFSPRNQSQSAFRYLGRQKMDGHEALVLA